MPSDQPWQTALHKAAKQILCEVGEVFIPALIARRPDGTPSRTAIPARRVTLTNPRPEPRDFPGLVPDVVAEVDGEQLLVEVYVAHRVGQPKRDLIVARRHWAMEIYLREHRGASDAVVRNAVLRSAERVWLFHPKQAEVDAEIAKELADAAALLAEKNAAEVAEREAQQERARMLDVMRQARATRPSVIAYPKPFKGPMQPPSFWTAWSDLPPVVSCGACQSAHWWSRPAPDPAMRGQRAWACRWCHPPPPGVEVVMQRYVRRPPNAEIFGDEDLNAR